MIRFIAMRILRAALTMLVVFTFTFFALRANVNVAESALSSNASPEALTAFNVRWGLDRPIVEQYFTALTAAVQGDFGLSFRDGRPATAWIAERLPLTFLLSGTGFLLTILIGIPVGIYAASYRGTVIDRLVMSVATAGYSLPNFVLALTLIYIFSVIWQILPSSGSEGWSSLVMPVIVYATASTSGAAALARFTRAAMLEVMGQPYILAARAQGVPRRELIFLHALPNAAVPLVTYIGFALGALVAGAIVVETVFAWPGLGMALSEAVGNRDLPIVQALVILFALFMVLANLCVDVAYGFINPKLRVINNEA